MPRSRGWVASAVARSATVGPGFVKAPGDLTPAQKSEGTLSTVQNASSRGFARGSVVSKRAAVAGS